MVNQKRRKRSVLHNFVSTAGGFLTICHSTFTSLSFQSRIGKTTIGEIVMQICTAIVGYLKEDFLKIPNDFNTWNKVSDLFLSMWNILNSIEAIDGKRSLIHKPS